MQLVDLFAADLRTGTHLFSTCPRFVTYDRSESKNRRRRSLPVVARCFNRSMAAWWRTRVAFKRLQAGPSVWPVRVHSNPVKKKNDSIVKQQFLRTRIFIIGALCGGGCLCIGHYIYGYLASLLIAARGPYGVGDRPLMSSAARSA